MNNYFLVGIILIVAYSMGDFFSKKFGESLSYTMATLSCLSYMITSIVWLFCINKGMDIGKGAVLFGVVAVFSGLFVGCGIFHEPLKLLDWVGIFLGVTSIVILSIK